MFYRNLRHKLQFKVLPMPTQNATEPPHVLSQYDGAKIPSDSDEYNQILEKYVYGKWVVTGVVLEPAEIMEKEAQELIIGTKIEYSKAKITNDFTKEKKALADPYANAHLRVYYEVMLEIDNPEYVIKNLNFRQYSGGGSYYRALNGEFKDLDNIKYILIFDHGKHIWEGLGNRIAVCDENRLVLSFAAGYWELRREE